MSVDFSQIIQNFLTAELGEEVRGSLVAIAQALQDAINAQLLTVTDDMTDPDPNAAAQAGIVGAAIENALKKHGIIDASVTALSSLTDNGWWFVPASYNVHLEDLPDGYNVDEHALIIVYGLNASNVYQEIIQKDSGNSWLRGIDTIAPLIGSWKTYVNNTMINKLLFSDRLNTVENTDADKIDDNNYYVYGSNDSPLHTPGDGRAGVILPLVNNANTSYQIGIDYVLESLYFRIKKNGVYTDWRKLAFSDNIPASSRSCVIQYYPPETIDVDTITESFRVYIPNGINYVEYQFHHYVIPADKCDVLRLYRVHTANENFTRVKTITATGEWECAIQLKDRDDFSGGSTHGDEEMLTNGIKVFVDNMLVSDFRSLVYTNFTNLRILRNSVLYDPIDHETPIANHGCEYVIDANGLKINQTIKWLVNANIEKAYLAMFPISKDFTDHVYNDCNQTPVDLQTAAIPISVEGVKNAITYGDDLVASFGVAKYPEGLTGGGVWMLTDNRSQSQPEGYNYYKQYYRVASDNAPVEIGDLWKSTTVYKILA